MTLYQSDDDAYDVIYAAWVREGRPYKLLHQQQAYVCDVRDTGVVFITIARDDPHWLDPNDPKKLWHGAYGYLGTSETQE